MRTKPYNFDQSPRARLEYYKAHLDDKTTKRWEAHRYLKPAFLQKGNMTRSEDGEKLFLDSLNSWPCSDYQDAHDVAKLDHTGWYADNFQDGLIRGAVVSFRNPHKVNPEFENDNCYWVENFNSHIFYMPATYGTNFDGATIYNEIYYSAKDCAHRADQLAERLAEDEREYDAQFQAELQIEEAREEIKTTRRQILDLIKEIKQAGKQFSPAICSALTGRVQELLHERQEAFERIDELKNDFWAAVEH